MRHKPIIIFDLDDTLLPSSKIYPLSLQKVGIKNSSPLFKKARNLVKERLGADHPSARNRFLYLKEYLHLKKAYSPEALLKLVARHEKALLELFQKHSRALKREALLLKLAKKYRLAVLTNENSRTQTLKISSLDPKGRIFERMVTSEEAGAEKPSDQIFDLILKKLGDPKAADILMVGDSWRNDIEPALRRGWLAIRTEEFLVDTEAPANSSPVITDLEDLIHLT